MIWVKHDFYANFSDSVATQDTELTINIFVSEVTDLLVYKPEKFFELFKKVGIKFSQKDSDEAVIDNIIANIQTNDKFIRGLAFLMAEGNDALKTKDNEWRNVLSKVTMGVKKIGEELKERPQLQISLKKDMLSMTSVKAQKVGNRKRDLLKTDNTALYLVLLVGAGFGIYYLWKYLSALPNAAVASEMAQGGEVIPPPVVPTNATQPTQPTAPALPLNAPPPDVYIGNLQQIQQPAAPLPPPQATTIKANG